MSYDEPVGPIGENRGWSHDCVAQEEVRMWSTMSSWKPREKRALNHKEHLMHF